MKKKIISIASLVIGIGLIVIICVYNGSAHEDKEKVASNNVEEKASSKDKEKIDEDIETTDDDEAIEDEAVVEDQSAANNETEVEQVAEVSNNEAEQEVANNSQAASANTTTSVNNSMENKVNDNVLESNSSNNNVVTSKYKDGTFKGTAEGYNGPVTVSVTISSDKITAINVVSHEDDDAFFNEAKNVINKIISSQGTNVDVVSGATYSSKGIINASASAINSAKN